MALLYCLGNNNKQNNLAKKRYQSGLYFSNGTTLVLAKDWRRVNKNWGNNNKLELQYKVKISEAFKNLITWYHSRYVGALLHRIFLGKSRNFQIFKVASEAEQWGRICWLTENLTKFRIFARFLQSALSASMASIWNFVKFSVNSLIRSHNSGIDATLEKYRYRKKDQIISQKREICWFSKV